MPICCLPQKGGQALPLPKNLDDHRRAAEARAIGLGVVKEQPDEAEPDEAGGKNRFFKLRFGIPNVSLMRPRTGAALDVRRGSQADSLAFAAPSKARATESA